MHFSNRGIVEFRVMLLDQERIYVNDRADPADIARAQGALEETNKRVLDMGGVPWKAEAPAQQDIIRKMDPNMFEMMRRVRSILDPNGIMNPGNWEDN